MRETMPPAEVLIEVAHDEVAVRRGQQGRGHTPEPPRRLATHSDSNLGLRPRVMRAQVS
jgi:hypothetical protein